MSFIHDDFLLGNKAAQRLYHEYAEHEPILDYHCHLPPSEIAENRRFQNLFEIRLEGDHYKWRAMRANGIGEEYCTGARSPREKFLAWASTVPQTLRNPLYHWTHLELKRYFGIDELLDEGSGERIWDQANAGEDCGNARKGDDVAGNSRSDGRESNDRSQDSANREHSFRSGSGSVQAVKFAAARASCSQHAQ